MGEVYLAEDARLRRKASASKSFLLISGQNSGGCAEFKREAYTISGLNHPNIITIYEIGASEGIHYLATEYVQGKTLRDLCRDGRVGRGRDAIEILSQVASALGGPPLVVKVSASQRRLAQTRES